MASPSQNGHVHGASLSRAAAPASGHWLPRSSEGSLPSGWGGDRLGQPVPAAGPLGASVAELLSHREASLVAQSGSGFRVPAFLLYL